MTCSAPGTQMVYHRHHQLLLLSLEGITQMASHGRGRSLAVNANEAVVPSCGGRGWAGRCPSSARLMVDAIADLMGEKDEASEHERPSDWQFLL